MGHTLITDIAAEVEVPKDGTLSRVLHRDDSVRAVAFAFDTGQELTEHTATRPAVVQVISGRIETGVGDDSFEMAPGAWLLLEPNQPHSLRATEPSVVLLSLLVA
jgi:quercetin dioxygenase-like cupin family protein